MMDFKVFIKEKIVPFSGFVLSRNQMPQINNIQHFKSYIDSLGIEVTESVQMVDGYSPSQFEYDEYKVRNIMMDWRKNPETIGQTKPIIVSEDNFVLDGHHRYFASKKAGTNIPVIKVYLPINKLLKLAYEYQEVYG